MVMVSNDLSEPTGVGSIPREVEDAETVDVFLVLRRSSDAVAG